MEVDGTRQSASGLEWKLHPLVLINISDHHTRTRANTPGATAPGVPAPAVMGCLLGSQSGRSVDIRNSFEVRYAAGPDGTLDIDITYLLKKQEQYKQVFKNLDVVGWYATGAAITEGHRLAHRKISEVVESPVFLLLDPAVDHTRKDLPVSLYETELHLSPETGAPGMVFVKSPYSIETSDAERIGVDQVARILAGGKATGSEQLSAQLVSLHSAIKMLLERLRVIHGAMGKVAGADGAAAEAAYPHSLLRQVSSLVHSLPACNTDAFNREYLTEYNDTLLTLYLASMTRGTHAANEVVDKFCLAYDKAGRRRGL
ncbi:hypothetical protein CHLRE_11g467647v5 [Chlamydomonas reinhardtii]|uniref:COP9 signalosome complex subunit 6 n=1 Tax=Chlamydomonas reinhardtii TaxID=3055 RepID=Q2MJW1_CHLRE|nr:uncharacterized protein CHLRE_11g467647v5 [Chlamydomonas reinhardtii]ABC49916.1 COP9 signalosome subunit 6 [Chlamydomonas reinhardtii]ABC49917.1 COP9 signalosome subunit 6 [Chlamydomonas reinhardtii]PNW76505.1 hypothetical protein CHLRE_11g467647v5 [Chlamydomonas reinhardtii]